MNKAFTKAAVVRMVSEDRKWSSRYCVRYALIKNYHTPMTVVVRFIKGMKTADLKELYADAKLPTSNRPFIWNELIERNETTEINTPETFRLSGDEDSQITEENGDL